LLQEFDSENRSAAVGTDFQCNRHSFAIMQCSTSPITETFDGNSEKILSELEMVTQLVKTPSWKHSPDQREFIDAPIKWVAV
jgi:hypothetical protein